MGKLVTKEINHKIIALKQAKCSYPAIYKQLNLQNLSTPRKLQLKHFCSQWNCFCRNPSQGRPNKLSKRDEGILLRKVKKGRFLSIQKLRTELNSFNLALYNLASSCQPQPHRSSSGQETEATGPIRNAYFLSNVKSYLIKNLNSS